MKFPIFLTFFFLYFTINAQLNKKTKWGDLSPEEINLTEVSFEKEADAVVLYESGFMMMKNPIQTKIYRRIKILTPKGIEQANKMLTFQHKNKLQSISSLRAQTLNVEAGKTVSYQLKSSDFFTKQINDIHTGIQFAFPNVKVGSVIEYEYTFNNENMRWIDAWSFQDEIPTIYSTFTIDPENLLAGFATIAMGETFSKTPKKRDGSNQYEYTLTNVKSFSNVQYAYNKKDQVERLILQLKSYYAAKNSYYNDTPQLVEITTKWTDLLKEIEDRQNSFTNPSFTKTIVAEIPKGTDELSYLQNIHDYFHQHYNWNGYTSTMPVPEMSNRQVHSQKTGSLPDLNLHLNSVLKSAGFDAKLVILSTREHGKIITSYPYLGQFNAVVNLVTLKSGHTFFMDASNLSNDLGFMPKSNYNQMGLLVDSKRENFISINAPISEFHLTQNYHFTGNHINSVITERTNGYFSSNLQSNPEKFIPSLDVQFSEKSKTNPTLIANKYLGSKITLQSEAINQDFYTIQNPMNEILKKFKFTEQARERALEFDFPAMYKIQSTIKIPEGYSVQIPANYNSIHKVGTSDLVYTQNAELKEGNLILTIEFLMNKAIFVGQYSAVKGFFEKVNGDLQKTILLKKN
jgi:hypothetical protein